MSLRARQDVLFLKLYGLFKSMARNLKKTKQRGERDTMSLRARHGVYVSETR